MGNSSYNKRPKYGWLEKCVTKPSVKCNFFVLFDVLMMHLLEDFVFRRASKPISNQSKKWQQGHYHILQSEAFLIRL